METKRQKDATLEAWEHQWPCSVLPSMWLLIWGTCTPVVTWKVTETLTEADERHQMEREAYAGEGRRVHWV